MGSAEALRNRAGELRKLSPADLGERLRSARADLFKLRADQATKQLENPVRIRELRRLIARILTIQAEDARAVGAGEDR
jgi:large subunit ribosomal protein L29